MVSGQVDHVTCFERSQDVLDLVAPYTPTHRLKIIKADALEWTKFTTQHYGMASGPIERLASPILLKTI